MCIFTSKLGVNHQTINQQYRRSRCKPCPGSLPGQLLLLLFRIHADMLVTRAAQIPLIAADVALQALVPPQVKPFLAVLVLLRMHACLSGLQRACLSG